MRSCTRAVPLICLVLCSIVTFAGMAQAAPATAGDVTKVGLDLYDTRTGTLRHVTGEMPTGSLPRMNGGKELVSPHPRLLANDKVMARLRGRQSKRGVGIDQPGRSPLQMRSLAAGKASQRVTGTWNALVLLVDFSDNTPTVYPGAGAATHYADMLFSTGTYPTGSMNDYYKEVSHNSFSVGGAVAGGASNWYRAPQTYAYYVNGHYGDESPYPNNCQKLVEDLVDSADADVNFANYDNDGDGYVDALFVVHAGPGAEYTGDVNDIWSHKWSINPRAKDGKFVYVYSIEPEDGEIGVFCHEFGHVLGLPDLYDTDYTSSGVGYWSLMAAGSWGGDGAHAATPSHLDIWSKIQLGWSMPIIPTMNATGMPIPDSETTPVCLRLWTNGAMGNEYFLVENRQKTGFDTYLPAAGLCIWHIDESKSNNNSEWWSGMPSASHYKVALEQADEQWNLEHKINRGDAGDVFGGPPPAAFFDGMGLRNSNSYAGVATNVAVSNIMLAGPFITADIAVSVNTAPEISLAINSGVGSTGSSAVTLNLTSTGGGTPSEMRFANDSPTGWTEWEAWSPTKSWTLSMGLGTKTVYAQARNMYGEGTTVSDTISYQVLPTVLLISDDPNQAYGSYYENALTAAGKAYTKWTVATDGAVTGALLADYIGANKAVIWYTGNGYEDTLTASDQSLLTSFLNAGGRLFVTGQDIGYDIAADGTGFYANYLHAQWVQDETDVWTLRGVASDPLSNAWAGSTLTVTGGDGANNQGYCDELNPTSGAVACFSYYTDAPPVTQRAGGRQAVKLSPAAKASRVQGFSTRAINGSGTAGLRVDTGTYRVVYFGFGFEAISNATDRTAVMHSVLKWLTNVAPPAPASVSIVATPAPASAASQLQATAVSGGADPDGDTLSYKYQWALVPPLTSSTKEASRVPIIWGYDSTDGILTGATLHRGERWMVHACATDGDLDSAWTAPQEVTIGNAAPTRPTWVTISPAVPGKEDLTGATDDSTDADDDEISYEYQWAKLSATGEYLTKWADNPGKVLSADKVSFGDIWQVRARAFDGADYSAWKAHKKVKIVRMVSSISPAADATNVAVSSPIYLTFKWPVDQLSVNRRLRVYCGGALVHGSAKWVTPNVKVRFTPTRPLLANTSYQVRLASGIICTGGRVLGWSEEYNFQTAGPAGASAVTVAAVPTAMGAQVTVNLSDAARVRTVICNIAGRVVAELSEKDLPAGVSSLVWNGRSNSGSKVPAGTYLVRVEARGSDGQQTSALTPLQLRR
ncbi:MAG: M6 family metalloprotease domain-containing protein [Armatimonadia bacterium]